MANSKIKLTYFDFTGRAEAIRIILTWAGKEFEDFRVSKEEWPKYKSASPFGQVPFVEIDGKVFGQSLAIAQYFAREFNLYGKTNLDALKIDQFTQLVEDFIQEAVKPFREPDEAKKAEIVKKVKEEITPKFLTNAEKLLNANNGKHFVGDAVTLADLVAYDIATGFLKTYTEEALSKFPSIKALVEKIGSNEKIKAYHKKTQK
jgi:glutathione S-transferase